MKLRKLIAAVAGLGLIASVPAVADAHGFHGGGYHGGWHHGGGHFGTGVAIGAGVGVLAGAAIAHEHHRNYGWYHSQPYYDSPYYYSRPDCPYGSYPAESPYRPGTWICVYD